MSEIKSLTEVLEHLPTGPFRAFGSALYAGPVPIAHFTGPDGDRLATAFAKLPDIVRILSVASPSLMAERIADLEEALAAVHRRCDCC